jgi:Protein of unknown function (DUF2807).
MKKIILLLTVVLLLTSCSGLAGLLNRKEMTGDGNVLGRKYEMTSDTPYRIIVKDISIDNYNNTNLIFDETLADELVISTDENIFLSFEVTVNDANKTITVSGDTGLSYVPTTFEITVGGLVSDINIAGGYNADIKFDTVKQTKIDVAGAVDADISYANAESAVISIAGAAELKLSGNIERIKADVAGAADIKGYELAADIADITIAGTSNIELTVNSELNADISGSSYIHYKGDGVIKKSDVAGFGEIIKAD